MARPTILLAEDDAAIRELIEHHARREGYELAVATDGQAALRGARRGCDLLVLDVGLPGIDGFDVVRTLRRERCTTPIVMLTARTDEVDRVVGFELGADDYVCKPFSPPELIARMKAILRRSGAPDSQARVLHFGRLEIDAGARAARVDGSDVGLKPREFALLLELAENIDIALSRTQLLQRVWGYDFEGDERTVDVHVHRLRARIEEAHRLAPLIVTVHGYGYRFTRR